MAVQLTLWSLPSLVAAGLAISALRQIRDASGRVPGANALTALCWCIIAWSLGQLVGTLSTDLGLKIIASKLQYPGVALLPVAWLAFALTYVRRVDKLRVRALMSMMAVPAVTIILAWSNELHRLLWSDVRLSPTSGFVGMQIDYGIWFTVHVAYSYALVATGTVILIYELSASAHHRRALVAVMVAPALVAVLNVIYLTRSGPLFIDLTPLGFALGALVFAVGVLRTGLFEVAPNLHRQVVERFTDGVLIFDARGELVDANAAARAIFGVDEGGDVAQAVEAMQAVVDGAATGAGEAREVEMGGRTYDLRGAEIDTGGRPELRRRVLVFRDITQQQRTESELRQVKEEMEHLAHTDALTELPNRRYFMSRLGEEEARMVRSEEALSVILLDLDHFKKVNDTYGHDTGDRVLQAVADIIGAHTRGFDVAARLGGEEFALLLPGTSFDDAHRVGDRIRRAIEAHVVDSHPQGPFSVTVSAGVATVDAAGRRDPLALADQALYRAKQSGRNAVCG